MERNENEAKSYKTYKRRYFILILLSMCLYFSCFQVLQYTSIGDVVKKYYHVTYIDVSWTATLSFISQIIFFFPISKFIEFNGIRTSMLVATFFLTFGGCLKLIACQRNLFWLLLVGQILGAVWFKSDEAALVVGLTNSLFVLGGITSFVLPLIFDDSNIEETSEKFLCISIVIVVSYGTFFFLTLFYVVDKPPSPPSQAENNRTSNGRQSLKTLFKNKNFLLLTITFALILGSSWSFTITLNHAVLKQFSNNHIIFSIAGILAAGSGIPGSLIAPTIMKKFPNYRVLEIIFAFCYALSFLLYLLSLWTQSEWLLYVSVVGYGLSMNALFVLTLDFIVEVSFPFTESIVYSFSFMGESLVALVEAPVVTLLTNNWGATNASFIYLGTAVVCLLLSLFVSNDMRRRKADCHEAEPLILHST
ncbi:hypothetical protein B4U79_18520 [Dinothrombium tinctorium]|uniref:Feline leukemia virus subgroup C receptor-related protein 2-like protein n=1 Tax=Dinothrombium tinctorium TaxID=1965070 RepID=A0A443QGL4_9ACAR|nr:hypothetical protein B4U79_18520 [Dinothrombium tinctorium]